MRSLKVKKIDIIAFVLLFLIFTIHLQKPEYMITFTRIV